jgi:circadian clock protein KaiC
MTSDHHLRLERFPSGVPGLDELLLGGLLKGGVYIIRGTPGAGKTILANQICFNHVAERGSALFVTLLAESHSRMLQHLQSMEFFDARAIPDRLYYVSGFGTLESEGLKGIVNLLRGEIKSRQASLVVLDGFAATEEFATSEREFKKFVHDIQSHAAASDCTVLLLTNASEAPGSPGYTMVDGVIEIYESLFDQRTERTLQIKKFRGSDFLGGRHSLRITQRGLVVFPRIEAQFDKPSVQDRYALKRISSGVQGLDEMLKGGLLAETTNGVYGPTGCGKTTLGLQFLALSNKKEPGLLVGFFESPERLRVRAETLGIDLRAMEARGDVEIMWRPQGEHILDEIGHEVINAVSRRGVKRLFVDGFDGLIQSAVFPGRITRFVSTFSNQVRAMNATTLISIESREILGSSMELPSQGMSSLLEGLMIMRYVEIEGRVHRLLSITKIRDSDFDPFLRKFEITPGGIEVGGTFSGVEAILSGQARAPKLVAVEPSHQSRQGSEE